MTMTTATATSVQSISSRPFSTGVAATASSLSMKSERPSVDERSSRPARAAGVVGRPSSLSLPVPCSGSTAAGTGPTTTPLTFASLGLDCMVDGHTGLTPITGAPSCSAGAQRPGDDIAAALHPAGFSPTTLMTLWRHGDDVIVTWSAGMLVIGCLLRSSVLGSCWLIILATCSVA